MKNKNYTPFIAVLTCLVFIVMAGCNSKEEKSKAANNLPAKQAVEQKLPQNETSP